MTDEARFLEALPVIDDVTAQVCRRHWLSASEADDFRSDVRLHFIDKNYEVLRKFEGRCALATYVTVVAQRVFLDWRNRLWGRWRPSHDARRLGPTAMLLERLVTRDGWTIDQALEMLRVNHGLEIDEPIRTFCHTIAARGPARRVVGEEEAGEIASQGAGPDDNVVLAERDFLAKRVQAALDRARQGLPPLERLILKMRFDDGVAVSDIARALHLEQRPLYRTIERVLGMVGTAMAAEGVSKTDIAAMFAAPAVEWNKGGEPVEPSAPGTTTGPKKAKRASWLRSR